MLQTLTLKANKGCEMTFKELREFVQHLMSMDMPDEAEVRALNAIGGRLKSLTIKSDGHEEEKSWTKEHL